MALQAIYALVLALQRVLGFRVIESLVDSLQRDTLPAAGVVTRLTALLRETAAMRISMAVRTSIESQAGPSRLIVAARGVTFLTSDLGVQAGERIAGLVVVELRDIFPVVEIVALLAILPQAAMVLVLMAVHAVRANPQKSPAFVANLDGKHLRLCNMLRRVTTIAGQSRVFSLQAVSGLGVIEPGGSRRPFNNREVEAIMFGVALRALLAGIGFQSIGSM